MKPTQSLGIYFQKDRIDLVCLKRSFQGFIVKHHATVPFSKSEEQNEVYKRLEDFIKATKSAKLPAYLGLPRKDLILLYLDVPAPAEENLRNVIGYELDRHTPYSKEEAYFDFQIVGRDEKKKMLRVLVVVVLKKQLDGCLQVLKKVGITPKSVELGSMAVMRVLSSDRNDVIGNCALILHRSMGWDEVMIAEKGLLQYVRSFATHHNGLAVRLSDELERAISNRNLNRDAIKEILVTGEDGDMAPADLQGLSEKTQYNIKVFKSPPLDNKGKPLSSYFFISFGLGLKAFVKERQPINLLQALQETKVDKTRSYWGVLLLLMISVCLGGALLITPIIQGEESLQMLTAKLEDLRTEVELIKKLEITIGKLEKKHAQLNMSLGEQTGVLSLTKVLTEMIPKKTWLSDLRYKKGEVEISGYSFSSSELIPILERSPHFRQVSFSAPLTIVGERSKQRAASNRGLSDFLRGSAPEPDPTKVTGLEHFKIRAVLEKTP